MRESRRYLSPGVRIILLAMIMPSFIILICEFHLSLKLNQTIVQMYQIFIIHSLADGQMSRLFSVAAIVDRSAMSLDAQLALK